MNCEGTKSQDGVYRTLRASLSGTFLAPKHARKHEMHPPRVKKEEFRLDSNDCGFTCAGLNFVGGYK